MQTQRVKSPALPIVFSLLLFLVAAMVCLNWINQSEASASQQPRSYYIERSETVTLYAEAWNGGYVHVWADLGESSDRYTDVADGTRCTKIDRSIHKIGDGSTAIFYHHLDCDGVTGYVQTNQAR